jgi:hypothetical protein
MQKIILLFSFLATAFATFAQEIKLDPETELFSFTQVMSEEGKTKDQLFDSSKEWIALTYKSANDVIQSADKENGTIIVKGSIRIVSGLLVDGNIMHTLVLNFKDNKIKFTVTNFVYIARQNGIENPFEKNWLKGVKKKCFERSEEFCNEAMFGLNKYISTSKKKDDW